MTKSLRFIGNDFWITDPLDYSGTVDSGYCPWLYFAGYLLKARRPGGQKINGQGGHGQEFSNIATTSSHKNQSRSQTSTVPNKKPEMMINLSHD
jgi:hypothetical protein